MTPYSLTKLKGFAGGPSEAPPTETELAAKVVRMLVDRGETVATAESLTGGLLGGALTSVEGSSAAYRGGLVVYATELKHDLAGVAEQTLHVHGAVSADTAAELAAGAARVCSATWGVATTGVAGPDPQEDHPAGTVFVAAGGGGGCVVAPLQLDGDRAQVRAATVEAALRLVLQVVRASGLVTPDP